MKPLRHIAIAALIGMGISNVPSPAVAAPNCPPQYQDICKQLIKVLEDNNDGNHRFTWDGTHLSVTFAFLGHGRINNSSTDHTSGIGLQSTYREMTDYFPNLLNQVAAASQGGQRVYLHLFQGPGLNATVASVSNTPLAPTTPMMVPSMAPNMVPQPVPQPVPNKVPQAAPQLQPVKSASKNQPKSVSVTHSLESRNGQKIDKLNVNHHFVTKTAGSLIESEERAYLFDNNDHVWSCKVSGLGARRMPSSDGNHQIQGHVETLQFRSVHLAHIPGNHPMHSGCLISVQQ